MHNPELELHKRMAELFGPDAADRIMPNPVAANRASVDALADRVSVAKEALNLLAAFARYNVVQPDKKRLWMTVDPSRLLKAIGKAAGEETTEIYTGASK